MNRRKTDPLKDFSREQEKAKRIDRDAIKRARLDAHKATHAFIETTLRWEGEEEVVG